MTSYKTHCEEENESFYPLMKSQNERIMSKSQIGQYNDKPGLLETEDRPST